MWTGIEAGAAAPRRSGKPGRSQRTSGQHRPASRRAAGTVTSAASADATRLPIAASRPCVRPRGPTSPGRQMGGATRSRVSGRTVVGAPGHAESLAGRHRAASGRGGARFPGGEPRVRDSPRGSASRPEVLGRPRVTVASWRPSHRCASTHRAGESPCRSVSHLVLAAFARLPSHAARPRGPRRRRRSVTGQVGVLVLDVPALSRRRRALDRSRSRSWTSVSRAGSTSATGSAGSPRAPGCILVERGGFSWTRRPGAHPDRPEDRTDALAGMGDRGFGVFGGSTVAYRVGPVEAQRGGRARPRGPDGPDGRLGLGAGGRWAGRWFGRAGALRRVRRLRQPAVGLRGERGPGAAPARAAGRRARPDLEPRRRRPLHARAAAFASCERRTLGYALGPRLSIFGTGDGRPLRARRGGEPADAGADHVGGGAGTHVEACTVDRQELKIT